MVCQNCGKEIVEGQEFCPSCGQRFIPTQQLASCTKCGTAIEAGSKFCPKCGAPAVFQDLKCRNCGGDVPFGTNFCPKCGTPAIHGATASAVPPPIPGSGSGMDRVPGESDSFQWFVYCLKQKYADFNGRARRKEYWYFYLFAMIVNIVLCWIPFIGWLASLALIAPSLSAAVRRLHDIGKSGWFLLLAFIPLVGPILLIVWLAKDGVPGTNQYGPNPKGI